MVLSSTQVLPAAESFEAPDWLTYTGAATRNCVPHFFWYVGWTPTTGVSAGSHATYTYKAGGALATAGTHLLYHPNSYQGIGMPALMTDSSGREDAQRGVLCREEAAFNLDDLDIKVVFGLQLSSTTELGATQAGRQGIGPGPAGRIQGVNYAGSDTSADDSLTEPTAGSQNSTFFPGQAQRSARLDTDQIWSGWKGNSVIFRAGGGQPQVDVTNNPRNFVTHVTHYAFTAYPVVDGSDMDLYFELWQVKYTGTGATDGTPRRLMQQIVNDGAEYIDFAQPYHLRVEVDNDGSSNPQITCFIGAYKHQTTGTVQSEVQCFMDGVFANNTYSTGTNVTQTAATGNISDAHTDKISAYDDKTIGWTMGRDRSVDVAGALGLSGIQYAGFTEGVYGVEVKRISTQAVVYCDRFERVVGGTTKRGRGNSTLTNVQGKFGTSGGQIGGMFTYDYAADYDYETGNKEIRRLALWTDTQTDVTTPNDYLQLDYDADDSSVATDQVAGAFRAFIHQRPSTQFYNHNRTILFKPGAETGTGSGGTYRFGILLRGTTNGINLTSMAYYIEWTTNGSGTITAVADKIAKIDTTYGSTDYSPVVVASLTHGSVSARPLYDGNYHTLSFDAYSNPLGTGPNALAIYKCSYGGSAVNFTDTDPPQQSSSDTGNPVDDIGPEFFGGHQEGFFFYSSVAEYNSSAAKLWSIPSVKSWSEGTLQAEPIFSAFTQTQASIPVASEGNLVPFINDRDDFERGVHSETKWYGSKDSGTSAGDVYAGSSTIADPFGNGGGSYLPGAPYFYNDTAYNTYLIYRVVSDLMTQNTGVKKIIKNGTPLTFSAYVRNRSAPSTIIWIWDNTVTTRQIEALANITWAATSAGAAVSTITKTLNGTGSRVWHETIGSEGWIRVFCEIIVDTSLLEDVKCEIQPNTDEAGAASGSCYIWGTEVQYGSLNVVGDAGTTSANGGLYMSGGGVFDVECVTDVEYFRPIRRTAFESGHTYTSGIVRQDRRRWRTTVRAADLTVLQNLQAFFNSHNGSEHPFFFTTPITDTGVGFPWTSGTGHTTDDQETVTGYFAEDNLQIQEIGPSVYDISFSVEELLVK